MEDAELPDLSQCRLCGGTGQLVRSHAIPRAALKKTKCSGKNIALENGRVNENHQSDGNTHLLCSACDNEFLGALFDSRGVELLSRVSAGERFLKSTAVDVADLMAGWVLSILWRAHHLQTPQYLGFALPPDIEQQLRKSLLGQKESPSSHIKWSKMAVISIYRLVDNHAKVSDHALYAAFPSSFLIPTKAGQVACSMFRMLGFEFRVVHQRRRQFGPKGRDREVLKSGKSVFLKDYHFMDNDVYAEMMTQFFV